MQEQFQQRSAAAAAPAATPAALPFTAPAWVGKPLSSGAHLKVYKEQDLISQVPLPSVSAAAIASAPHFQDWPTQTTASAVPGTHRLQDWVLPGDLMSDMRIHL
jgi:hypothetical protein